MRRADRLLQLIEYLRARRHPVTAERIAGDLEVSVRTVYRDMSSLMDMGVPVHGEAGLGYVLRAGFTVPPMMFDMDELEALSLGVAMVQTWSDDELAEAASRLRAKVEAIVPSHLRDGLTRVNLLAPEVASQVPWTIDLAALRRAIRVRRKVRIDYRNEAGAETVRVIRPLALAFFGPVWLCTGWCELRDDFRNFRVDRMSRLETLDLRFADEPGKRMADYAKQRYGCGDGSG